VRGRQQSSGLGTTIDAQLSISNGPEHLGLACQI
jgi:hypothetical protein